MKLVIRTDLIPQLKKAGVTNKVITDEYAVRWRSTFDVQSRFLSEDDLKALRDVCSTAKNKEHIENRRIITKVKALIKLKSSKTAKIRKLEAMTEALIQVFADLPNHRFYAEVEPYGAMLPYVLTKCKYAEPNARAGIAASISFTGSAICRGDNVSWHKTIHRSDMGDKGSTVMEVIDFLGIVLETDELNEAYENELESYNEWAALTGQQFNASGYGESSTRSWYSRTHHFGPPSAPGKVVINDESETEDREDYSSWDDDQDYVTDRLFGTEPDDEDGAHGILRLPVHPLIMVFDLRTHDHSKVHVSQLTPYEYDDELADKLVMPDDNKDLIDMLIKTKDELGGDIVRGKSGGVIILCSGPPGTGKTLTAECYSEHTHRPLYVVQCSQLGTDPDELEKELSVVLTRASAWDAILLIDEADVYIHERGDSMKQNAVVGVFLRLLEYYSGVLFLTTNRETVVDDAIKSRCIAHVRYSVLNYNDVDDKKHATRLWRVQADNWELGLSDKQLRAFAAAFPKISGRSIKQLLRLAKVRSATTKKSVSVEMLKWIAKYQDLEENGNG